MNDLKFAFRQLLKHPGFTAVAVLTLALGIGASTVMFSVVQAVLLQPLPYREPARLVTVCEDNPARGYPQFTASAANLFAWREQASSFEGLAAEVFASFNLAGRDQPVHVHGAQVTGNYFALLGARFAHGRGFSDEAEQPGKGYVAVLANHLWRSHFGADPGIVGQSVSLHGVSFTVVGVLGPEFRVFNPRSVTGRPPVSFEPQVWIPHEFDQDERQGLARYFLVWGRLKPGVTLAAAQAEMTAISARLAQRKPESNAGWGTVVRPIHDQVTGEFSPILTMLLGAVGCVVLIACANVANLYLARGIGRQKELSIRAALGAGALSLSRLVLAESTLVALLAGAAGLAIAQGLVHVIPWMTPPQLPRLDSVRLDSGAITLVLGLSLCAGLLSGLAPLWQALRRAHGSPLHAIGRELGQTTAGGKARAGLQIAQVALAVMVLAGSMLLIRSFHKLASVNPGFRAERMIAFDVTLPDNVRYNQEHERINLVTALQQRVNELPGVQSAAVVHGLPFGGMLMSMKRIEFEGRPDDPAEPAAVAGYRQAGPGYFGTLQIPILRGREFTSHDNTNSPVVFVINEAFARKHYGAANPVGQRIRIRSVSTNFAEIIGVVGDVKLTRLDGAPEPEVYAAQLQKSVWMFSVVARVDGDAGEIVRQIRQELRALDPGLPAYHVRALDDAIATTTSPLRFAALLMGGFGALALVLAAVGLYAVLACGVLQRTREMGVRSALGAQPSDVVRLVLRQGIVITAIGIVLGTFGALALARSIRSLLFGIEPADPLTFVAIPSLLTVVALLASWLPARRAATVDPMEALRSE